MGNTRKARRKYLKPSHPWQKGRIETERTLVRDYGLKNKKEVWKANTFIKRLKDRSKLLSRTETPQAERESKEMLNRLVKLGIISESAEQTDVLSLSTESALERRLQTVVFKKGYARTVNQARQMIVHGHIAVNGKKITFPSYFTTLEEAATLTYTPSSHFNKEDHPELHPETQATAQPATEEKGKEASSEEQSGSEEPTATEQPSDENKSK